jgi:5-formyltetrahydrofolate cyclo-ligase
MAVNKQNSTSKEIIRESIITKRLELKPEQHQQKSAQIRQYILNADFFLNAQKILFYSALPEEVDLDPLIAEAAKLDKDCYLPCLNPSSVGFSAGRFSSFNELILGKYRIKEPQASCEKIDPAELDLVLVPAVGIDQEGNRLGFGTGYYDRFLINTQSLKIATVYNCQLISQIPTEDHDVKMDGVVSEQGLEWFKFK